MKTMVTLLFLLSLTSGLSAQNNQITTNAYKGEGTGETAESAKAAARADLLLQIQNFLSVETTVRTTETSKGISSSASQKVSSQSWARLNGLSYSVFELSDGTFRSVAWISYVDFESSMAAVADELRSAWSVLTDPNHEKPDATLLKDWYLLYLRSYYSPRPVAVDEIPDLRLFLETKIRSAIRDLNISIGSVIPPESPDEPLLLNLLMTLNRMPAEGLAVSEANQPDRSRAVRNGKVPVFMYGLPSGLTHDIKLSITPRLDDLEVPAELLQIQEEVAFSVIRQVTIDFTPWLHLDFSVKKQKNGILRLIPEISPLSVRSFQWDFGDGTFSNEQQPRQFYQSGPGPFPVTLTINGSKDLSITKYLMATGDFTESPLASETKEAKPIAVLKPGDIWPSMIRIRHADTLMVKLKNLKSKGFISFGRSTDFINPESCNIIVYDPETKEIAAFLTPVPDGYREAGSGKRISSVRDSYKGLAAIYLEIRI